MGPSPSPEAGTVTAADAEVLLDLAEDTLDTALAGARPRLPDLHRLPPALHARVGVFVTLTVSGQLNGCIGTIDSDEPLGHAVPRLTLSAAFDDPRLPPLRPAQRPDLGIELSLLSPLTPTGARSHAELLAGLRPGIDGLVVQAGAHRGVFLPSVWAQLPDPEAFLDHLWAKAGLRPRRWPDGTATYRFTAAKHARPAP